MNTAMKIISYYNYYYYLFNNKAALVNGYINNWNS